MIDRATLLGMFATLALVLWVACGGGTEALAGLWQTSSAALVIGGALFTTLAATPGGKFRALFGVLGHAAVDRGRSPEDLVATLVRLAHIARRDGLLSLEQPVELLDDDFLKRGLRMAVDGVDARTIEQVCKTELEGIDLRHSAGSGLLESMGRAAPVFGMIGTLIGLATMLGRMDDPAKIGPGMAVALLTTLYGLLLAHVFCWPLARKLTHRSSEELVYKSMTLAGMLAIHAGDHPRLVEQKVRAYLPTRKEAAPAAVPSPKVRRELMSSLLKPLLALSRFGKRRSAAKSVSGAPAATAKVKPVAARSKLVGAA